MDLVSRINRYEGFITRVEHLYIKGILKNCDELAVAVVGSRKITDYGRRVCSFFVEKLARSGVTIISGLMYGVDQAAHEAALKVGGRTIGVLGYGFNYLNGNALKLADKIINSGQGAIITEFENETPPQWFTFPKRNRIVAALSKGVLVIEAAKNSGSIITANYANDMGIDVFAVPGSIFSPTNVGKHDILKSHAQLVDDPKDILERLNLITKYTPSDIFNDLSFEEKKIAKVIFESDRTICINELIENLNSSTIKTSITLTSLELKGLIKKDYRGGWSWV